MTDTKMLFTILVFLAGFMLIQGAYGTEVISSKTGWNASYDGTNSTVIGTDVSYLTAPPVCTGVVEQGWIPFLDDAINWTICVGGYLIWLTSLMFFTTDIAWLNAIIILPLIAIVGFIIIKLARGT